MLKSSIFLLGLALGAPAAAGATTCDGYFEASRSMANGLSSAFDAMNTKDSAAQAAVLPQLDAALNALPATEIKPETCADHINAYTSYQYTQLSLMRANGIDTGFSTDLPLVKQPDLNHASLAYAVGWIKYEKADYNGALAAYDKGLKMLPHNHELQQEYVATLVQLGRYQDVVATAEKILNDTFDLDDASRGKLYAARGIALVSLDKTDEAKDSLTVAQRYNYTDDVQGILDQLDSGATD